MMGFLTKIQKIFEIDRKFFTTKTHPANLAIFRIVFFASIFLELSWRRTLFYSQFPPELRIPPDGLGWLIPYLPINYTLAVIGGISLYFFCFLGIIGFFSRASALLTAIIAFYVLGIEAFFGDVSHARHHIIWFSLVLAASPCGDVLSCDAFLASTPAVPSVKYTLPLRLIWILFGIIYFFPGFWKLSYSGLDWALSDNMKYQLYGKWYWINADSMLRIDQYPLLYKLSGLGTLFFETSFIFLIFFRRLRYFPIAVGAVFHVMTYLLLNVPFWSLLSCYVVFFDWYGIYSRLGQRFGLKQVSSSLPLSEIKETNPFRQLPALYCVGAMLLSINLFLGFTHTRFSWPFACYPTFRCIRGPQRWTVESVLLDRDRKPIYPEKIKKSQNYGGKRLRFLINKIVKTQDQNLKRKRIKALLDLWISQYPEIKNTAFVHIYKYRNWVLPEKKDENPISRKFVEEIPII